MKQDKALAASEAVRGRLNVTGAARRDAIARERGELPSYTEEELQEITGRYAALAADAAAGAVADALTERQSHLELQVTQEPAVRWTKRLEHTAKMSAAVAGILAALTAFGRWLYGLRH